MSNKMVVLALALCLLLLSGCQSQQEDTMEGKIQGVVETVFTIQEGEQMDLRDKVAICRQLAHWYAFDHSY